MADETEVKLRPPGVQTDENRSARIMPGFITYVNTKDKDKAEFFPLFSSDPTTVAQALDEALGGKS